MRVFVPMTLSGLRQAVTVGGLGPSPLVGYAVTAALREHYATGDEEELEYIAMTHAARKSLELLAAMDDEPARRLVIAADARSATADAAYGPAGVDISEAVRLRDVAAVHADTDEARPAVAAAVDVLRQGGPRDDEDEFVLETCEARELAWFATQEIGDLLG